MFKGNLFQSLGAITKDVLSLIWEENERRTRLEKAEQRRSVVANWEEEVTGRGEGQ